MNHLAVRRYEWAIELRKHLLNSAPSVYVLCCVLLIEFNSVAGCCVLFQSNEFNS